MTERWTIRELSQAVSDALAEGYEAPENGQIRAVPNQRTIRYYTSLGLLDRPAAMDGRTALYERRHLAQLVAIKRLQSAGKSLAEIQSILAGATAADTERIARLPEGPETSEAPPAAASERASFWLDAPAAPPAADQAPAPRPAAEPAPPPAAEPSHQTVELAPGLLLVIDTRLHPPTGAAALRRAAAPLIEALNR